MLDTKRPRPRGPLFTEPTADIDMEWLIKEAMRIFKADAKTEDGCYAQDGLTGFEISLDSAEQMTRLGQASLWCYAPAPARQRY